LINKYFPQNNSTVPSPMPSLNKLETKQSTDLTMPNNLPSTIKLNILLSEPALASVTVVSPFRKQNKLQCRSINSVHNNDHYMSLNIFILWVCKVKMGNFICQEGKRIEIFEVFEFRNVATHSN